MRPVLLFQPIGGFIVKFAKNRYLTEISRWAGGQAGSGRKIAPINPSPF